MDDRTCVELLQWALPRMGLRWRGFSTLRKQVCKRISRRQQALGVDAAGYRALLERDEREWDELARLCRVTITRFYRDRAVYDALGASLIALARAAVREGRPLRAWSAGCASGEEPYTLALLLELRVAPEVEGLRWDLVASDVDAECLERARRGCYPGGCLRELPEAWKEEAFERKDGAYCLRPRWRRGVEWRLEDVRHSMPDGPFDLVLCRNLAFTYFDEAEQARMLEALLARLRPGGLLVIGAHETLPGGAALERASGALPLFRR